MTLKSSIHFLAFTPYFRASSIPLSHDSSSPSSPRRRGSSDLIIVGYIRVTLDPRFRGDDDSLVGDDDSLVGDDGSLVGDDDSLVGDDGHSGMTDESAHCPCLKR
ncbi:hypothetical protein E2F43_14365 [Seongchinamella unica]|uniref:Uncharacterized protein n=1 Tax=Seongchinamella unica TaxID=2547392 RepID=A0A4R5LQF2_9GAMM|nr:hypothetical protein E2F43_14365 [Seongchinamella unica]